MPVTKFIETSHSYVISGSGGVCFGLIFEFPYVMA